MISKEINLKKEFLERINFEELEKNRLPKTIVISFLASVGSGKSTVSKLLSKELKIPILDNDGIRRFLNEKGYLGDSPLQELVIDIARDLMKMVLDKKISYILDADLTLTYPEDIQRISAKGAHLLLIKIECPENIVLARINSRQSGVSTSLANEDKYFERQKLRNNISIDQKDVFFTIDNSKDLVSQINNLVSQIQIYLTKI